MAQDVFRLLVDDRPKPAVETFRGTPAIAESAVEIRRLRISRKAALTNGRPRLSLLVLRASGPESATSAETPKAGARRCVGEQRSFWAQARQCGCASSWCSGPASS